MKTVQCTTVAVAFALAGSMGLPAPSAAQGVDLFTALVKRVDNLGIYWIAPANLRSLNGAGTPDLRPGVGFELVLLVYEWDPGAPQPDPGPVGRVTEIQVVRGDTVRKHEPSVPPAVPKPWALELGISYSDQPFTVADPTFDMRGSLRDHPAISLYLSRTFRRLAPYGGVRFSSFNVSGGRAYVPTDAAAGAPVRVLAFGGNSLAFGVVTGLTIRLWELDLVLEGEMTSRRFESVQWPEKDDLPAQLPRRLQVRGPILWAGTSVQIGKIFQ